MTLIAASKSLPALQSVQGSIGSPIEIEIREWEPVDCMLPAAAIADLARMVDKAVSVQLLPNGMTRLTANSVVGRLRVGTVDLLIEPKMPVPSLLTLLAEVHELAQVFSDFAGFQETSEIVDLLIHVFLNQVDYLAQRGLRRTYVSREEELVPIRGRLDVRQTFKLHMRAKPKVVCSFDDYTLDSRENQVLLSALRAIIGNPSILKLRRRLAHKLTADFLGVSDVAFQARQLESLVCDRLTSHYEPALRLARMILASMGLASNFGGAESCGFLLNMNELFEQFVYRRLSALLGANRLSVSRQVTFPFDDGGQAKIRPDLVIQAANGRRVVADTKYKRTSTPDPADLYQMLAYCRVMRVEHGVLITAGNRGLRQYRVCDGETIIDVLPIDLDGPVANVHRSVEHVANWMRSYVKVKPSVGTSLG